LNDAIEFALRVFLKQGIWIVGAAWLVAVGSREIFSRADGAGKSSDDEPENVKRKIIIGALVLIVGIIIALIPIK
jgi:hypothetical protein